MEPHESSTYEEIQRQKRNVAELRAKVAAERGLLTLRRLSKKVNNKKMPSSLRDSSGRKVQDQSTPRTLRPRGASGTQEFVTLSNVVSPLRL